jgi:hypothetical protein
VNEIDRSDTSENSTIAGSTATFGAVSSAGARERLGVLPVFDRRLEPLTLGRGDVGVEDQGDHRAQPWDGRRRLDVGVDDRKMIEAHDRLAPRDQKHHPGPGGGDLGELRVATRLDDGPGRESQVVTNSHQLEVIDPGSYVER